jgi:Ca2+-binding EF-hand superfamily protein
VFLGKPNASQPPIELAKDPQGLLAKPAGTGRPTPRGSLLLDLEDVEVEFRASDAIQDAADFFDQQFKNSDGDKNGYLERKEVEQTFLLQYFDVADRDGDGKLYEKEMKAFTDLQSDAVGSRVLLSASDGGRALFEMLDSNHDQFLSVRELRNGRLWLKNRDRNGDGLISLNELPRRYQLSIGRGQLQNRRGFFNQAQPGVAAANLTWFQKMDRNHDGDISLREFLGSLEDFQRFDVDHDGLIDSKEAAGTP